MARDGITKLYTRVSNTFSEPISGQVISPTDAADFWDDLENALNSAVGVSQTGTGIIATASATDFGYPYSRMNITSDGVDVSGLATGKDVATGLLLEMYPNGTAKGSRNAATFACWVPPGSTVNTSANYGYCGLLQYGATDINLGGTDTGAGAKGAVFGGNSFARGGALATNLYGAVGHESDVLLAAGSTTKIRAGYSAIDFGCGAGTQGASYDAAFSVGALSGSVKWKTGVLISDANGGAPIDSSTGKLFATQGAATVNYGVDISSYTITTAAFKSTGFVVDGSGKVNGVTIDNNAWTSYSPAVVSTTGTITTSSVVSASYKQIGKTVHFRVRFSVTTIGTGAGRLKVDLPFTAITFNAALGINTSTFKGLTGLTGFDSATTVSFFYAGDGSFPITSGEAVHLGGTYETT